MVLLEQPDWLLEIWIGSAYFTHIVMVEYENLR